MTPKRQPEIWTIGHSTLPWETFVEWLVSFQITCIADVRSLPGSRKFPQFDQEKMALALPEAGIQYVSFKDLLGGRRKGNKNSKNIAWHHPSFRGYADYMETENFRLGINELENQARKERTALMCAEALWWRCHRSMISDYLKNKGWNVIHIMGVGKFMEHSYTKAASIMDGELHYDIIGDKPDQ